MIATVTLPAGAIGVRYGRAEFLADENRQVDVPQYVAKAILGIDGVTGDPIAQDDDFLIAGTQEPFELTYLFLGHGVPAPQDIAHPKFDEESGAPILDGEGVQIVEVEPSDIAAKAAALLSQKGAPVASLT